MVDAAKAIFGSIRVLNWLPVLFLFPLSSQSYIIIKKSCSFQKKKETSPTQILTMADQLTSTIRPKTDATLTIRIIKSFRFRTERNLVLHHINLEQTTVGQLKELSKQGMDPFLTLIPGS